MGQDAFPPTQRTRIFDGNRAGPSGRRELARYLMDAYFEPLQVYFKGTRRFDLGEPADVVTGFFERRLADRDDYLAKWEAEHHASGMPLRRWLMNGFALYLKEETRRRKRDAPAGSADPDLVVEDEADPRRAFDRAAAGAIVRDALRRTATLCADKDQQDHFTLFREHFVRDRAYADLAPEMGVDTARAAVMARTAGRHFVKCLRERLSEEGIPDDRIDDEINELLGAFE